jgi:hypothetical protein
MKRLFALCLFAGLLATGTLGCRHTLHYSSTQGIHRYERGSATGVLLEGGLVGPAIFAAATSPDPDPEPPLVEHWNGYYGPYAVTPSPRDAVKEDGLPSFDPQAARVALNDVDVSPCRAAGAPVGFGHARVSVHPDGQISNVVIDAPGLSSEATQCISDAFGQATVKPFRGSFVTIGTTYHVGG